MLVYSGSTGYRHESIPAAVESHQGVGRRRPATASTNEDPEVFTAENLAKYKALVLVSNSTDPKKPESEWFTGAKRDALQGFLKAGKGVIGLHAASDSHYDWDWYGQMIGGYFERHPEGHAERHGHRGRRQASRHGQTTEDASSATTSGTTTRISIRRCAC